MLTLFKADVEAGGHETRAMHLASVLILPLRVNTDTQTLSLINYLKFGFSFIFHFVCYSGEIWPCTKKRKGPNSGRHAAKL